MHNGWIKLHRKIQDNPIYANANMLKLWIHCLLKASHKERSQLVGNQMVKLNPGDFVTGRQSLSDEFNKDVKKSDEVSAITLWRWLNNFEEWGMLNIKKTTKYSVVSVVGWSEHQHDEQQMNNKRTTDEQQMNNKRTTDEQQLITNKNVKNLKNENNVKNEKQQTGKKESSPVVIDNSFGEIVKFYEKNKGPITPHVGETLGEFVDEYSSALTLYALKKSVEQNPNNFINYTRGILKKWHSTNLKTIEQIESHENNRKHYSGGQGSDKQSVFAASPETLERQRQDAEKYKDVVIDDSGLPF